MGRAAELPVRVQPCRRLLDAGAIHLVAVAGQQEKRHDPNHDGRDEQLHAATVLRLHASGERFRSLLPAAAAEWQADVGPALAVHAHLQPDAAGTAHDERAGPAGDRSDRAA